MADGPVTRMEWVSEQLRSTILSGEFKPGQKLNTEQLARSWGVSPTPLREIYHRLAAEGLVELIPQRGARVASVSMDDALDLYGVRLLLEPHALRLSLRAADEAWRTSLQDALEPLRRQLLTSVDDVAAFERTHQEFHAALLSKCNSVWLTRITANLQAHSVRYRLLSIDQRGGAADVLREHEELLEACLHGDHDVAVQRLQSHLQLTIDSLMSQADVLNSLMATSDNDGT